jgi:hypothetical protein
VTERVTQKTIDDVPKESEADVRVKQDGDKHVVNGHVVTPDHKVEALKFVSAPQSKGELVSGMESSAARSSVFAKREPM